MTNSEQTLQNEVYEMIDKMCESIENFETANNLKLLPKHANPVTKELHESFYYLLRASIQLRRIEQNAQKNPQKRTEESS